MKKYLFGGLLLVALIGFSWNCAKEGGVSPSSDTGKGGSLARFAIVGNFMYTVSDYDMRTYDLSNPAAPRYIALTQVGRGIETIFAFGDKLFIGSQNGVYMYQIEANGTLTYKSIYTHFQSCDPVVADGRFAYSTIRGGRDCRIGQNINELNILDVSNINAPILLSTVKMTFPIGLGIDGDYLFVCDNGLRILNVADRRNPREIKYLKDIDAVDVIIDDQKLLIIGKAKVTQLDYRDINNPVVISTLNLK
jgi:hypothetical protein